MLQTTTHVLLPDGKRVQVSSVPQTWWTIDGGVGYIDPHLLAPDPDQPRGKMNPQEQAELAAGIRAVGVREIITVTPMSCAPWAKPRPEHAHLPFLIVSGHRRTDCAISENIGAVQIRVVIYPNELEHRTDASVLNKNRSDLSPLEQAYEIDGLKKLGATIEKLRERFGVSYATLNDRLNLAYLHPNLQKLLDTELPTRQQIPLTVAQRLGGILTPSVEELEEMQVEFSADSRKVQDIGLIPVEGALDLSDDERRLELQKVLYAVIKGRGLNVGLAVEFIHERNLQLDAAKGRSGKPSQRFQPLRRKVIMSALTTDVTKSTVAGWTPGEFERIFEASVADEVSHYRGELQRAAQILLDIGAILDRIIEKKRSRKK